MILDFDGDKTTAKKTAANALVSVLNLANDEITGYLVSQCGNKLTNKELDKIWDQVEKLRERMLDLLDRARGNL